MRTWNSKQILKNIQYLDRFPKSIGWRVEFDNLIYKDYSLVKEEGRVIIVPLNSSKEILMGHYNDVLGLVDDLKTIKIQIESNEEDCVILLSWKLLEDKSEYYLDPINDRFIPKNRYTKFELVLMHYLVNLFTIGTWKNLCVIKKAILRNSLCLLKTSCRKLT